MIGFGADNAAVMMGNKAGVKAKLMEVNPSIFVMGCTCHSLHLCASAATRKLSKSVEEFCRNAVTNRILDSWDALKLYFTNYQLEDKLRSTQKKELYLGAKAEKMLSEINVSPEELKKLKTNVLAFYVELAS
ncbi:hypothetical protein D910_02073 [Dendroctonus ponderosae]|uniref:DUF4371 domain-containing protein n=1 Tax=Dendroctonus ponderosae TaxID=77166 RepID=U4U3U0_DENPD|nr:hypothetical protein D910_02073 [Dendroctonus ponderosae]